MSQRLFKPSTPAAQRCKRLYAVSTCEEWNLFTEDRPLLSEEQFKINQPEGVYYQIYMKIQDIVNNALDVDKKLGTVFLDKEISLVI